MAFEFKLPDIGEGVVEGEIVKWKVAEGDVIKMDQPMVEVMTDKATVEIPAPKAGRVQRIMVGEGKICAVGQVMIVIEDGGASASAGGPAHGGQGAPAQPREDAVPAVARGGNGHATHMSAQIAAGTPVAATSAATAATAAATGVPMATPGTTKSASTSERILATPATRRLARELGVELGAVAATGKHGRVTSDDVRGHHAQQQQPARGAHAAPGYAPVSIPRGGDEERVPLRGLRKAIASNMARSKSTAAHFTYVEEIDVTDLVALRARTKDKAAERGVKLSYLPFIVKAAVAGLRKWPSLNSALDETTQEIVYKKYYHVGMATQGPQGLSVGILRDADQRSIFGLSKEIERIAEAIRQGKATREELTGGTFTISSLGQLGGVLATPIINFPEVAIMGVHKIAERAVVRSGQIVARHIMNLSISVDHRIADGYDAAMFLQEVKAYLEDPTLMFMEMV